MESFTTIMLIATIIAYILIIGGIVITIFKPKYRLWPPPGKNSWQFWTVWILSIKITAR